MYHHSRNPPYLVVTPWFLVLTHPALCAQRRVSPSAWFSAFGGPATKVIHVASGIKWDIVMENPMKKNAHNIIYSVLEMEVYSSKHHP